MCTSWKWPFYHLPIIILIIIYHITFTYSQTYISDGNTYWQSTSTFTPISSTHDGYYGNIRLREHMIMSFFLKWNGRTDPNFPSSNKYEQIFRIGWPATAGGCGTVNSRYPSLWIDKDTDHFHLSISESDGGNCGKGYKLDTYQISTNTVYFITIDFNDTHIFTTINDTVITETRTLGTRPSYLASTADPMNVYIASDFNSGEPYVNEYIIANVEMWDINIQSIVPPSVSPTAQPTISPTQSTLSPTGTPTAVTNMPTESPSSPSNTPTSSPSTAPPSKTPTDTPTNNPTPSPTSNPTPAPTNVPSNNPSRSPSMNPTKQPSKAPSTIPTSARPSSNPSSTPSQPPTLMPSNPPSNNPTSMSPSLSPSRAPSESPSTTSNPSNTPTAHPIDILQSIEPTSSQPTISPTDAPTDAPTENPTSSQTTEASTTATIDTTYPDLSSTEDADKSTTGIIVVAPAFSKEEGLKAQEIIYLLVAGIASCCIGSIMIYIIVKKCQAVRRDNKRMNSHKLQMELKRMSGSRSRNNGNPFTGIDEENSFTPKKMEIPLKKPSDDLPFNDSNIHDHPISPIQPHPVALPHGKLTNLHNDHNDIIKVETPTLDPDEMSTENDIGAEDENQPQPNNFHQDILEEDPEDNSSMNRDTEETDLMTKTESTALSPSATTYTLTSDAKMQMMMARKYLMSESNEERYIETMMNNAVVISKGNKDKNKDSHNPHGLHANAPQLRHAQAHLAHHHHLTARQRQAMMRRNLSPNFIHGHHGNPAKHLLVINDEDVMNDSSHSQLSSSQILEEVDDDEPTVTETETLTERKEQHMLGLHNDNLTESVSRYTVENVHIFDVDEDVDSLPVLPATVTDGDNVSVTWVSKDGFQYDNNGRLMSSNDTQPILQLEQTHAGADGYGWVKAALMEIDSDDWRTYVSNFKKNKVTENRLKDLKGSDLRELIPKIGPRNEFEKLLRQRLDAQRYKE